MTSNKFFVSTILPVYNGEEFLSEAIDSVLAQQHSPHQVIIVDDGSTDQTAAIVKSYGNQVEYIYQENQGAPAARNTGVSLARGEFISFQDADDLWTEDKLRLQLQEFVDNPEAEIVTSMFQRLLQKTGDFEPPEYVFYDGPHLGMNFKCAVIRRSVFDRVGIINQDHLYCDDWDWFMRAREEGVNIQVLSKVTISYRRHECNITNDMVKANSDVLKMLKESLDRRREKNNLTSLPRLLKGVDEND